MKEIELVKKSYEELQDMVIQLNTDKFILQSKIDKALKYIKDRFDEEKGIWIIDCYELLEILEDKGEDK